MKFIIVEFYNNNMIHIEKVDVAVFRNSCTDVFAHLLQLISKDDVAFTKALLNTFLQLKKNRFDYESFGADTLNIYLKILVKILSNLY